MTVLNAVHLDDVSCKLSRYFLIVLDGYKTMVIFSFAHLKLTCFTAKCADVLKLPTFSLKKIKSKLIQMYTPLIIIRLLF